MGKRGTYPFEKGKPVVCIETVSVAKKRLDVELGRLNPIKRRLKYHKIAYRLVFPGLDDESGRRLDPEEREPCNEACQFLLGKPLSRRGIDKLAGERPNNNRSVGKGLAC